MRVKWLESWVPGPDLLLLLCSWATHFCTIHGLWKKAPPKECIFLWLDRTRWFLSVCLALQLYDFWELTMWGAQHRESGLTSSKFTDNVPFHGQVIFMTLLKMLTFPLLWLSQDKYCLGWHQRKTCGGKEHPKYFVFVPGTPGRLEEVVLYV